MKRVIYEVHSDEDENNLRCEFTGHGAKQRAIRYAKENESCWVDKVIYNDSTDEYEYIGGVWNYSDEE